MKEFSNSTIIIPTLNEEKNIGPLIKRLTLLYPKVNLIVADDGSTDNTRSIAEEKAVVIDRTEKRIKGITASVLDAAQQVMTENIIVMDADFQHPPEKVGDIIRLLSKNDIVIAVREKVIGPWGPVRRLESRIATSLARLRVGKVRDPLSGFFGIKTGFLKNIDKTNFEQHCFKILFNMLKKTDRGTRIGYVLYDFDMRRSGESKIRKQHIWYFLKGLLR